MIHIYVYIYIHTLSFSHTIFHHILSQETAYTSLCCTVGPQYLSILNVIVCIYQLQTPSPSTMSTFNKNVHVLHTHSHTHKGAHSSLPIGTHYHANTVKETQCIDLQDFFWPCPWHTQIPGPRIEPERQQ